MVVRTRSLVCIMHFYPLLSACIQNAGSLFRFFIATLPKLYLFRLIFSSVIYILLSRWYRNFVAFLPVYISKFWHSKIFWFLHFVLRCFVHPTHPFHRNGVGDSTPIFSTVETKVIKCSKRPRTAGLFRISFTKTNCGTILVEVNSAEFGSCGTVAANLVQSLQENKHADKRMDG